MKSIIFILGMVTRVGSVDLSDEEVASYKKHACPLFAVAAITSTQKQLI